jgi:hypothetical protein
MARLNLVQAINLTILVEVAGKPTQTTLNLVRGENTVDPSVLTHPYIQAHMKNGTASIIPDPLDPEDIAAAAEEIARQARARADAAKALKADEQKKIDDALSSASLKQDGPTVQDWVAAGYKASVYPSSGYASKSTQEEIDAAVAAEKAPPAATEVAPAASSQPVPATPAAPDATAALAPAAQVEPAPVPAPAAAPAAPVADAAAPAATPSADTAPVA